jgi:competence protein ComEA
MPASSISRVGWLLLCGLLFAAPAARAADADADGLDAEAGSFKTVCARCHNLQIVTDTPRSYDEWHQTVQKMVDRGASGTDDQFDDVMDYLHRTVTVIDVNTADSDELQIVLDVTQDVARAIVTRRAIRQFSSLADLETVPGMTKPAVESRARLIRF